MGGLQTIFGCSSSSKSNSDDRKSQSDLRCQGYYQLFFWFAMLIGLLSPVALYYITFSFFPIWPVIQRFFILFTVNCSWLTLVSPIGYFLLQGKILNKFICIAYSISLCTVIVAAMVSIAFIQSQDPSKFDLDDLTSDNSILNGIKDYFNDYGEIPLWLQELQSQQKCCGLSGPEDWQLRIYPPDKPAIEDVPESCCITKVVGCNLVIQYLHNKTELSHWIWTDGCRKTIDNRLNVLLMNISCGCLIIMVIGITLVSIYWCQIVNFINQASTNVRDNLEIENFVEQIEVPIDTDNNLIVEDNFDYTENYPEEYTIFPNGFTSPRPNSSQVKFGFGSGSNNSLLGSGTNSRGLPSECSSSVLQQMSQEKQQRQIYPPPPMELQRVRSVQFNIKSKSKNNTSNNNNNIQQSKSKSKAALLVLPPQQQQQQNQVEAKNQNQNQIQCEKRRKASTSAAYGQQEKNSQAKRMSVAPFNTSSSRPKLKAKLILVQEPDGNELNSEDLEIPDIIDPDPGDIINTDPTIRIRPNFLSRSRSGSQNQLPTINLRDVKIKSRSNNSRTGSSKPSEPTEVNINPENRAKKSRTKNSANLNATE